MVLGVSIAWGLLQRLVELEALVTASGCTRTSFMCFATPQGGLVYRPAPTLLSLSLPSFPLSLSLSLLSLARSLYLSLSLSLSFFLSLSLSLSLSLD